MTTYLPPDRFCTNCDNYRTGPDRLCDECRAEDLQAELDAIHGEDSL